MEAPLSILETFKNRHSVRTFKTEFPEEKMTILQREIEYANSIPTPFNSEVEVSIHGPGLGTMGFISGESGWLVMKTPEANFGTPDYNKVIADAAFRLQVVVMRITQYGIGTVWVAGTYSQSTIEAELPGYKVLAVVAFGLEESRRFFEKAIRFFAGCENRKSIPELFFDSVNNRPFNEENTGEFNDLILSLRSGPSAMNVQPWRFNIEGQKIHLFNSATTVYSQIDMGIALGNIYFFYDGHVQYVIEEPTPSTTDGYLYICTATPTA